MKQIKVEAFLCIDEHGNYQVVGSSKQGQESKMIAIVEDGIKNSVVNSKTTSFKVMVDLPEPKKEEEQNDKA